jgi:hypothetical protein
MRKTPADVHSAHGVSGARSGSDQGEFVLRSVGLVLAIVSTGFAAHMISDSERRPEISGMEHLSIFNKPSIIASRRTRSGGGAIAHRDGEIDFSPVGSVSRFDPTSPLPGFNVVKASADSALIRGPRGALFQVVKGDLLAGIGRVDAIERRGGRWVVVTPNGLIVER